MKLLSKLKITPYKSGYLAEFICRLYMRLHGYRIIFKNYRTGSGRKTLFGEIDFIAQKGNILVFCEVKKRKTNSDFLFALSPKQQQRIKNSGENFIKQHKQYKKYTIRFDVFFVKLPFKIRWIKNAF